MTEHEIMRLAIEEARKTMQKNIGGPFGAAIVDEQGEILAVASNQVLQDGDPTAHAEVTAIRKACQKRGSHDLSGCTIYATGYPCPMCLSAIMWANIKRCKFGAFPQDAEKIGFRDQFMYDFIREDCKGDVLELTSLSREECVALYDEYEKAHKKMY